uniref:Putative ribonuclease H-like domain-containing protein n=1 Tax=Tanacetum cinerariifolium TaxID=118510 RepID=A0A699GR18_TANCI|nr:putative ribonuclease H-like domain-containing protein [Tanacetum cinerariifolium]
MSDCDDYLSSGSDESLPHSPMYDRYQSGNVYHAVPPLYTRTFMPPKHDLVFNNAPNDVETDHPAFTVKLSPTKLDQDLSHTHRPSAPIIENWVFDSEDELKTKTPQNGICPICLNFKDSMVDMLPLEVIQRVMCYNKNSVPFTDTECLVLSPEFKLPDENQVLLRVPRENNMYNVNLKNIVPSGDLTCLETQLSLRVKVIRRDNGTEFKNNDLNQFWGMKGIKRQFSVPRTPQQNGIAERKKRTLIEAARTMLADSLLPISFWAENTDRDAAFDEKEAEFDEKKPEYEVNVSPSMFEDFSDNSINKDNDVDTSQLPDDPNMPELEDITYSDDEEDVSTEADINNLETSTTVSPIPTTRVHKYYLVTQIIGDLSSATQIRDGKRAIGTKCVFRNKKDERGIVVKNKAQLVTQGHTQEEGINYEEFFAPVSKIEAIRLFLAYASFMGFTVYKIDVKSAFRYETIKEEVYVCQPLGFEDLNYPDKKDDILLVQIYVDDIIFGSTNKDLCKDFEKHMKDKFQMSLIGELTFFLGLQVKKEKNRIFISQDKYVAEILRKFSLTKGKSASTPIDTKKPLLKDPDGEDPGVHTYRSMIGSLMYLTSSRPDIMFAPKDSPFDLVAYSDSDYVGASIDRKSTTGGCQFLGCRLISLQCNKQTVVATSSTKADDEKVRVGVRAVELQGFALRLILLLAVQKFLLFGLTNWCCSLSAVRYITFEGMLAAQEVGEDTDEVHAEDVNVAGVVAEGAASDDVNFAANVPSIPSPTPPTPPHDHLKIYLPLPKRVEHLEQDKIAQALEITKLKSREGIITNIDADEDVVLEDAKDVFVENSTDVLSIQDDEESEPAELQEVVYVVTTAKIITEVVTAASTILSAAAPQLTTAAAPAPIVTTAPCAPRRRKGVKEDKAVKRYQALKRKPQTEAQARKNMMIYFKNVTGFRMDYFKGMIYDDIRLIFEKHFDLNMAFLQKTKNFDKEDLEALWRLVKEQFATTKPKNFFYDFLLITLGAMFKKPDIHAQIWKSQRSVHGQAKVKSWKLLESYGVQIITYTTTQLILLLERRYPLIRFGVDAAMGYKENMLSV